MKKKNIDVEKIAERIKEEYNYMDKLPAEGWIWEIIRRTRKYQDFFKEAEKLSTNFSDAKYQSFAWEAYEVFNDGLVRVSIAENDGGSRRSKAQYEPYYACIHFPFDQNTRVTLVPRPSAKYVDLQSSGVVYHIRGSLPYRAALWREVNWFEPKKHRWRPTEPGVVLKYWRGRPIYIDEGEAPPFWYEGNMIKHITIGSKEETLYIGISKKARVVDIEKGLLPIIQRYLEPVPQRMRTDKWKYYIVAYDLYETGKMTYREIANLFDTAYARKHTSYDEKDIQRYHSEAVMLIEKEAYQKYLSEPVFGDGKSGYGKKRPAVKESKELKELFKRVNEILNRKCASERRPK